MTSLNRILVVEDEAIVAKDIEMRLRAMGYTVIGLAASGEKALAILADNPADLILMDIHLKGQLDGIQTAALVRDQFDIPVVYLTAFADSPTLERAIATDPFGYVLKPFEERSLQIHIEIAYHKYQSESEIRRREKWIEAILSGITSAVIATDCVGVITYLNPAAEAVLGMPKATLIGRSMVTDLRLFDETDLPITTNPLDRVLKKGTPQLFDQIGIQFMGAESKVVQLSVLALRDHRDVIVGSVIGLGDISRRRETERELRVAQTDVDFAVATRVRKLKRRLDQAKLQLKLRQNTIKQLRKIERRYTRLVGGGEAIDE